MECKNTYLESLLNQILNRTFNIKYYNDSAEIFSVSSVNIFL